LWMNCLSCNHRIIFSTGELLEKRLHQVDPENQLITLLSGVTSVDYH
jgi:hypothetical protein